MHAAHVRVNNNWMEWGSGSQTVNQPAAPLVIQNNDGRGARNGSQKKAKIDKPVTTSPPDVFIIIITCKLTMLVDWTRPVFVLFNTEFFIHHHNNRLPRIQKIAKSFAKSRRRHWN